MHTRLAIDYIVAGSVVNRKEYLSNKNEVGEATLSLYVIDVKNKTVVWQSTTRTVQSPVQYGKNPAIEASGDADSALQIAYKKSVRKLVSAFELVPARR